MLNQIFRKVLFQISSFACHVLTGIFYFPGNKIMDYNGIPGWRIGAGPDEGRQLRGDAHSGDPPRGAARPRLPPLREETAQGHQGRQRPAQRDGRRQTG